MNVKKVLALLFAGALSIGSLAACGSSETDDVVSGGGETAGEVDGRDFEVVTEGLPDDSPTLTAAQQAGKIRIGVKEDQPGLGYKDPTTEEYSGFDIEIATWIAAGLGFPKDDIEFVTIPSANREQALKNGDVDFYVGTYSITDKRKNDIGFAGPYFETGQGLLVAADNEDIKSEKDLKDKTVCSATGSTPIQNIKENFPEAKTTEFDSYSQCVDALLDGSVDAVTTDEAILLGYASQNPEELKVVGEPFSVEKYGVGVPKDDKALRHYINGLFVDGKDTWLAIYDGTLGASGVEGTQPEVDDYED